MIRGPLQRVLFPLAILVLPSQAGRVFAQSSYVITDTARPVLIGDRFEVFSDTSCTLDFEAVRSASFTRSNAAVPNLGVTTATVWLRTRLINRSHQRDLQLQFPQSEIEDLQVILVKADGTVSTARGGQVVPIADHPYDDYDLVYTFELPEKEACELYLRLRSTKQVQTPIFLGSATSLGAYRSDRNVIIGIYFGVMLVLFFYNLFVYFSTRDRSYLVYVVYISLVALTQAVFLSIARYYLWPSQPWFSIHATSILTVVTATMAVAFMRSFIQTRELMPRLDRGLLVLCGLLIAALMVRLFVAPRLGYQIMQPITGAMPIYQLVMAAIAVRRGSRPAKFFLLAWTIFLLGIVAFILKDVNVLPFDGFTQYTMPLGSAVEGVLLSFGLADKINILRREKELSQAQALHASQENERIIREQNVVLEHKVKERTHELQESNEHLKRTQSQLVNAEKMASVGQLTAGIAHEINNPVNFITSNIPPLRRNLMEILEVLAGYRAKPLTEAERDVLKKKEEKLGLDDSIEEMSDIIGSIEEGAGRTAEIVRGLRNFSRLDEDDLKPADLNEGIRSTLTVLGPQIRDHVEIKLMLNETPKVECFPGKLNQVFMNMLTNAAQAVKERFGDQKGEVVVSTGLVGDRVVVAIRDNGIGMSEAVKTRVFEPFFTTKEVGEGTGLGLSIAYSIVEKHRGRIEVDSIPGEGTEFRVLIPISQQTVNEKRA